MKLKYQIVDTERDTIVAETHNLTEACMLAEQLGMKYGVYSNWVKGEITIRNMPSFKWLWV